MFKRSADWLSLVFLFFSIQSVVLADEVFRFERLWPQTVQPWYFSDPRGIAVGDEHVYIADTLNHRILKYTLQGQFIRSWGQFSEHEAGKFQFPGEVTVNAEGQVYVADTCNRRIQIFTEHGEFIRQFPVVGIDSDFPCEFENFNPIDLAVSQSGDVIVSGQNQVSLYSDDGILIRSWGSQGSADGQFQGIAGLVLSNVTLFVVDSGNERVQVFDLQGNYVRQWSTRSEQDSFSEPVDIAIDQFGQLYVTDRSNARIKKYDNQGVLLLEWGQSGNGDAQFSAVSSIAVDFSGLVFVTDALPPSAGLSGIQKFTDTGLFVEKWSSGGSNKGEFLFPAGLAISEDEQVYVADPNNHRIQIFSKNGLYLDDFGSEGDALGEFNQPSDVLLANDSIYVLDRGNSRIQRFTATGEISSWGAAGTAAGQFTDLCCLASDSLGNIYVADTNFERFNQQGQRIQKFNADGEFILQWGGYAACTDVAGNKLACAAGKFHSPRGIAVDRSGDQDIVVVADHYNARIQRFTPQGDFVSQFEIFTEPEQLAIDHGDIYLTTFSDGSTGNSVFKYSATGEFLSEFGGFGSQPGRFRVPSYLALGADGLIYVSDRENNRIQSFRLIENPDNSKAIIVAAGGPYPGNHLWDSTQLSANLAYFTLTNQGYSKDDIFYLSSNSELDLDLNGLNDTVDADVSRQSLSNAILDWASDADNLLLYLSNHGGEQRFRLNDREILSASELDQWLDQLQQTLPGRLTIIYDACESGSFIPQLTADNGKQRLLITSSKAKENAYFIAQGSVSFSSFFLSHIFNGENLGDAFELSSSSIAQYQTPQVDANGNGIANETDDLDLIDNRFIGNGNGSDKLIPVIGQVSPVRTLQQSGPLEITANQVRVDTSDSASNRINRVWAVIRPPNFQPGTASNPVQDLPVVELLPTGTAEQYRGRYEQFNVPGRYQITLYAKDLSGRSASPKQTEVIVESPLKRRAIILTGMESDTVLQSVIEFNSQAAYFALKRQGYSDDDIYFLSNAAVNGIDARANITNLQFALERWQSENTQDLILYLTGENIDKQAIRLNAEETVSFQDLKLSLDNRQQTIPGIVSVIYDASHSGAIVENLSAEQRIIISSSQADQAANFVNTGELSFSRIFWTRVLQGSNVRDAFRSASSGLRALADGQIPQLDDNGNALANDGNDGRLARDFTLGQGLFVAEDEPQIIQHTPTQTLIGTDTSGLELELSSIKTINTAFAVITRPDFGAAQNNAIVSRLPVVSLNCRNSRCWGQYDQFDVDGEYAITLYAKDDIGITTLPVSIRITKQSGEPLLGGAVYDDQTGVLRLYNVAAGTENYYAELFNTGHFVFALSALRLLDEPDREENAEYEFAGRQLSIPDVFAFGRHFQVEMVRRADGNFIVQSVN